MFNLFCLDKLLTLSSSSCFGEHFHQFHSTFDRHSSFCLGQKSFRFLRVLANDGINGNLLGPIRQNEGTMRQSQESPERNACEPIGWGVIGCAGIAQKTCEDIAEACYAQAVAVASRAMAKAANFVKKTFTWSNGV